MNTGYVDPQKKKKKSSFLLSTLKGVHQGRRDSLAYLYGQLLLQGGLIILKVKIVHHTCRVMNMEAMSAGFPPKPTTARNLIMRNLFLNPHGQLFFNSRAGCPLSKTSMHVGAHVIRPLNRRGIIVYFPSWYVVSCHPMMIRSVHIMVPPWHPCYSF